MSLAQRLAGLVDALPGERVLVAVDGPDAAGKTTLADAVAQHLSRPCVRASVDDWNHPREVRMRRGSESPEGYYLDAFDHPSLLRELLVPFRAGASRVRTVPGLADGQPVPAGAALLVDGVFLLRPEVRDHWDLRVHLDVTEEVTLSRAVVRDLALFGDAAAVRSRYRRRYLPGQALYRAAARPVEVADVVVDNSDWQRPVVLRWPGEDR